jgi:hypothetical protein
MVTHMNRLFVLCCALLALAIPLPARADIDFPPAMARDAANAVLPAARNNLGLVAGLSSGVLADSIAIAGRPTGYAAGDTVTLTCAGCTIATNPVVVVSAVSAGVPTSIQLRVPGAITAAPSASPTFTQNATSGAGTGLQVTASLGPRASDLASPGLNTGGAANGNFILGNEPPLTTLYGVPKTRGSATAHAAISTARRRRTPALGITPAAIRAPAQSPAALIYSSPMTVAAT